MAELTLNVTWRSTHVVELDVGMLAQAEAMIDAGGMPQVVADQIDGSTVEMVDWEIAR